MLVPLLVSLGCEVRKPIVKLHDVELSRVDLHKMDAVFIFEVINLNTYSIKLRSLEYDMTCSGEEFAAGGMAEPVALPAQGATLVRAPVAIEHARLLSVFRKIKSGDRGAYELHCRTNFDVLGVNVSVPFVHKGEIAATRPPKWDFRTIRLAAEDRTVLQVVFDVTNPNAFDLPVIGVTGFLKCGGETIVELRKCPTTVIPAGRTVELVIPVRLAAENVVRVTKAIAKREAIRFEGELKMAAPVSLRAMLLGKKD